MGHFDDDSRAKPLPPTAKILTTLKTILETSGLPNKIVSNPMRLKPVVTLTYEKKSFDCRMFAVAWRIRLTRQIVCYEKLAVINDIYYRGLACIGLDPVQLGCLGSVYIGVPNLARRFESWPLKVKNAFGKGNRAR